MVKNCEQFLKKIKELKLYMIEFNEDGTMKNKKYPLDCTVSGEV